MRNAVQEVGGAIKRIHDPAMRAIATLFLATFFTQEVIGRAGLHQFIAHDLFGFQIRLRDEIARPLDRDLEVLHFTEVTRQRLTRLDGGLNHDIEKG
ncbi:hypothetical protein D3C72_1292770 [compost metagenome]